MHTIEYYLTNNRTGKINSITLPTSANKILDFNERLQESQIGKYTINLDNGNSIEVDAAINTSNIPESHRNDYILSSLNHLATEINELDVLDVYPLEKLIIDGQIEECITVDEVINYVYKLKTGDYTNVIPAETTEDLAEYYLECNMIDRLDGISREAKGWIYEYTNYSDLGEDIVCQTGGMFLDDAFIIFEDDDLQLYDNKPPYPKWETHAFELDIICKGEETAQKIKLPANKEYIEQLASQEVAIAQYQSVLPTFNKLIVGRADLPTLNNIAHKMEELQENNSLVIFKAMVESLPALDVNTIFKAASMVDEFELQCQNTSKQNYLRDKIKLILPEEYAKFIDFNAMAEKEFENNGMVNTDYGMLVSKDGQSLEQKIQEQDEQTFQDQDQHDNNFDMNMY